MAQDYLQSGILIGGKYRLEDPIGAGGFSKVYRATHTAMERPVAIKIFDASVKTADDLERATRLAKRFVREARLVSQLSHPNTVTIFDFGIQDDRKLYLVMEYIEGPTLKEVLAKEAPLDRERTITIFMQILASLEEAHHCGMLHRDLKPANIILGSNFKGREIVKVLDFGIAQMVSNPHRELSARGRPIFLGTPRYAAPEQLAASELSFATDVFGVGALLWECLLGEPMNSTADLQKCIARARSDEPWTLPADTDIPVELVAIIEKAVEKDPSRRYQDATEMLRALEGCTTIKRSSLPEIKPSPFLGQSVEIFDPNITNPDEGENFFLTASPPPTPASKERSPRRMPTGASRPVTGPRRTVSHALDGPDSSFSSDELELDIKSRPEGNSRDGRPEPHRRLERHSGPRRAAMPHAYDDPALDGATSRSALPLPLLAVALILVAVVGIYFALPLLQSAGDDDVDDDWSISISTENNQRTAEEPTRIRSPFSVNGIERAIRGGGWQVLDADSPVDVQQYLIYPMVIGADDAIIDVSIYEFSNQSALETITTNIPPPIQQIIMGHIVVRLDPRNNRAHAASNELHDYLTRYRDLVLEEASR